MIKPYTAVGLIPTVRGIRKRADIMRNIEHLKHLVKAASWLSSLDLPVRLIAFPEGALQAFNDEVLDLDHVQFARECAIDIPGEETEELGKIARTVQRLYHGTGQSTSPRNQRSFLQRRIYSQSTGRGDLTALQGLPPFPVEHSVCPHDILIGGSADMEEIWMHFGLSSIPKLAVLVL